MLTSRQGFKPLKVAKNSAGGVDDLRVIENSILSKDAWEQLDTQVVEESTNVLNGVADLTSRGLIHSLRDIGVTISQYEATSDMTEAHVSMSIKDEAQKDLVSYELNGVPVPVISKRFEIDARTGAAGQAQNIDTTNASEANRQCMEALESTLFNGSTDVVFNGVPLYGYTTAPQANTGGLAAAWDAATGAQILADTIAMLQANRDAGFRGDQIIYVPDAWWLSLDEDFKANSDRTILERLLTIPNVADVKPTAYLETGVVSSEMTRRNVDMAVAQDFITTQWEPTPFCTEFAVWGVMAPRIKQTKAGRSGVAYFTQP